MSEQGEGRTEDAQDEDEGFVPRGAIAFVAFMVVAYAATWLFLYFLLIGRA